MADSVKIKALTSSDANTLAGQPHSYYLDANNFTNMPPSDVVGDTTPQLGGNLDLNSNNITGTGDIGIAGDITLTSTDAGSTNGPVLDLYRNSPSPSSGDYLGQIAYSGENSNGGTEIYAKVTGKITDPTLGSEDGLIETAIKGAGSFTIVSRQRSDELQLLNGTGLSVAGNTTLSGTLNGHTIPGGSGTLALTSDFNASTTDTLTNKTINLSSNTLSGTTAQFNTALSDGSFRVGYQAGEIIETIACMCDGSTVSVQSGNYTITNCSAAQASTSSYVVMTGSEISYTPPTGTTRVLYRYNFKFDVTSYSGISHFKVQVDGTDVVPSSRNYSSNYASTNWHHANLELGVEWVFDCNAASDDAANGKFTSWTSAKTIRGVHRHYGGGYTHSLHSNVWWDGAGASGTRQAPIKPFLYIQAIA